LLINKIFHVQTDFNFTLGVTKRNAKLREAHNRASRATL